MHRRVAILACLAALAAAALAPTAATANTATSASFSDDPWIDQYIEQIPSAGGPKKPGNGARDFNSASGGFSENYLAGLSRVGGDRYASAMAAAAPRIKTTKPLSAGVAPISSASALVDTLSGSADGGLGLILPITMIASVFAAIAIAGSRLGRRNDD